LPAKVHTQINVRGNIHIYSFNRRLMEEAVTHASKVAALQTLPIFMEKDDRHYHVSCACPLNALVAVQGRVSKPVCTIH